MLKVPNKTKVAGYVGAIQTGMDRDCQDKRKAKVKRQRVKV
jgi:hypothetical protein